MPNPLLVGVDVHRQTNAVCLMDQAGQVLGPLVAARLADDAGNFGAALIAASAVVALGGLLMPAVGLFSTTSTRGRKEYVHGNRH